MKTFLLFLMTPLILLPLSGCDAPESHPTKADSNGVSRHAPSDTKPGSYEDWCDEHQVPESHCTRCNPSLEAAFKATGDWCSEHRLPESQCLRCNPKLKIERPPRRSKD